MIVEAGHCGPLKCRITTIPGLHTQVACMHPNDDSTSQQRHSFSSRYNHERYPSLHTWD